MDAVAVAAGTGVDADVLALGGGEAVEDSAWGLRVSWAMAAWLGGTDLLFRSMKVFRSCAPVQGLRGSFFDASRPRVSRSVRIRYLEWLSISCRFQDKCQF